MSDNFGLSDDLIEGMLHDPAHVAYIKQVAQVREQIERYREDEREARILLQQTESRIRALAIAAQPGKSFGDKVKSFGPNAASQGERLTEILLEDSEYLHHQHQLDNLAAGLRQLSSELELLTELRRMAQIEAQAQYVEIANNSFLPGPYAPSQLGEIVLSQGFGEGPARISPGEISAFMVAYLSEVGSATESELATALRLDEEHILEVLTTDTHFVPLHAEGGRARWGLDFAPEGS